ncbi:class I SAM-dependent methyltransferase [Haloparvum sp. PAK95]|uniref:class I SAM-dependent methyltransferase n=1 Tax=Haloparvum sp. PAK95 TaxID=3418962 RepID=UPI003D2F1BDD
MSDETDRRTAIRRGYDDLADAYAAEREPSEGEVAAFQVLRDRLAAASSGSPTVVDAGCGAGTPVLEAFDGSPVEAVGIDFSSAQLARANERGSVLQGDVTALPIRSATADAVTAFHSTIHVPTEQHEALYREFARVLRAEGWLLASVGEEGWTGSNPDWLDAGAAMHWSFPPLETTKEYLRDAGFSVVETWRSEDSIGDGSWAFLLCRLTDPEKGSTDASDAEGEAGSL